MKAVVLLTANPGFQEHANKVIENFTKESPVKGVNIIYVMHLFGRFDGVIICDCQDAKTLGSFVEALRENGVFHTETLIAID